MLAEFSALIELIKQNNNNKRLSCLFLKAELHRQEGMPPGLQQPTRQLARRPEERAGSHPWWWQQHGS